MSAASSQSTSSSTNSQDPAPAHSVKILNEKNGPEVPPKPNQNSQDIKVFYRIDNQPLAFVSKIAQQPNVPIRLEDLKRSLGLHKPYRFFFKALDAEMGFVKEEIKGDQELLPICEERITAWLVSMDDEPQSLPHETQNLAFQSAAERFNHYQDQSALSTDTESVQTFIPPTNGAQFAKPALPRRLTLAERQRRHTRTARFRQRHPINNQDTTYTTDSEAYGTHNADNNQRAYYDDNASRISSATDLTSVSRRQQNRTYQQSSFTDITESSLSLNIITVNLNMESNQFVGINIVGQANSRGEGALFVGSVAPHGAVARDGRIEPGDQILQVNNISFENMTNQQAVDIFKKIVAKHGSIKLVVAKGISREAAFQPREEPVHPIDLAAWVTHGNAYQALLHPIAEDCENTSTPTPAINNNPQQHLYNRLPSEHGSENSGTATLPALDGLENHFQQQQFLDNQPLNKNTSSVQQILDRMGRRDSGLDIRARTWLKLDIPNAFLGSDLVSWLMANVIGLDDRKHAKLFACELLKCGFIRHTNNVRFSEHSYYAFNGTNDSNNVPPPSYHTATTNHLQHDGPVSAKTGDNSSSTTETVLPQAPPPSSTWAPGSNQKNPNGSRASSMVGDSFLGAKASGYASMPFQYAATTTTHIYQTGETTAGVQQSFRMAMENPMLLQ